MREAQRQEHAFLFVTLNRPYVCSCRLIRSPGPGRLVQRVNAEWRALVCGSALANTVERRDHAAFTPQHLVGECDEQSIGDRGLG